MRRSKTIFHLSCRRGRRLFRPNTNELLTRPPCRLSRPRPAWKRPATALWLWTRRTTPTHGRRAGSSSIPSRASRNRRFAVAIMPAPKGSLIRYRRGHSQLLVPCPIWYNRVWINCPGLMLPELTPAREKLLKDIAVNYGYGLLGTAVLRAFSSTER